MKNTTASRVGANRQIYKHEYFKVSDGLRLHYRDYAGSDARPPLLCLPGLTRNARDFAAFAERYAPRFRVLALEFRGRSESDYDPQKRYNPLTYARDVIEFLDGLAIEQAIFVGTSLGGLVTMTVAMIAPQRIFASILNDIGPELMQVGLDRIQSYVGSTLRFKTWHEAAAAIAASQTAAFPRYGEDDWLAMARRVCREGEGEIGFDYDPAIADVFKPSSSPSKAFDMWPLFRALAEKPLLLVRGELSELLGADTAEKMRAAAPGMQFVNVPEVGHAPMLDEPEAAAAIDAFLGSVAP